MLRKISIASLLAAVVLLGGCAHPLSINPDLAQVTAQAPAVVTTKVARKAGLVMAESDRALQVTTPGGGGDRVTYQPYRDLEAGLYAAMSQVFTSVTRVAGPADAKVRAEGLQVLVTPRMTTHSSSESMLTWPPTSFSIALTCQVSDADGKPLAEFVITGSGRAEFDEFKANPALSANRAAEDMLKQLVKTLAGLPALR